MTLIDPEKVLEEQGELVQRMREMKTGGKGEIGEDEEEDAEVGESEDEGEGEGEVQE